MVSSHRNAQFHLFIAILISIVFIRPVTAVNVTQMQFTDKVVLETTGYSADIALHPTDGSLHVAWVTRFGDIKYAIRNFNGAWSSAQTIPDGGLAVYSKEEGIHERKCMGMCIDSYGTTHIVFVESGGDLYYVYGVPGQWSTPKRIVNKESFSVYPDIVAVQNNLYVVYEDADQDKIYGVYRIGGSWSNAQLIATGEYPSLATGSNNWVYFLCRGGKYEAGDFHRIKFAVVESGKTNWVFKSNMTNPEGRTGQGPGMWINDGKIYLAWSMQINPEGDKKNQLFCATSTEPGNSWTPRMGEATIGPYDHPYYENTGDPHSRVSVYSDGLVIHMNSGRNERFRLWNGNDWTGFRNAPWNNGEQYAYKGILQVVNDGRTMWAVISESSVSSGEVVVYGIINPNGEVLHPPAPDAVDDLEIITKNVKSSSGFSGDVAVNPANGNVRIVWVENGGVKSAVRSMGGIWSSSENIPVGSYTVYGEDYGWARPCLALDIDHAGINHIVFSTNTGNLYYLNGQTGSWGDLVKIADHDNSIIYPDIEVWQNTVSVIYQHVPDRHIYSVQSRNGVWETPVDLGEGENPVLTQGKEGRVYLCYRGADFHRSLNFGWCVPNFTRWEMQYGFIAPDGQSGASPGLSVWDNKIYVVWNNDTGAEFSDYKSQLYCTIGDEPGSNWHLAPGSYGPVYSENTSDPHTRVSTFSDGQVLYLNGRGLQSRFALYNGTVWSRTRTGPWLEGYPNVDTDGKTIWIIVTSNMSSSAEVSLTGIRKPDAENYNFDSPFPEMEFDIDTLAAEVNRTFTINLGDFDGGGQSISVQRSTVTPLLSGMNLNLNTNTFTWTPQAAQLTADPWGEGPGKHLFGITVTTAAGKSETIYFWIKVINENQSPVISSSPVTEAVVGENYTYPVIASDPDGDALTFNLQNSPPAMTIHSQTGEISWMPGVADEGEHQVTIVVTDARGDFTTQSYTISVIDLTVPPPVAGFSADTTSGIYPLEVSFTNQSAGDVFAYLWDFGDFQTSTDENATHTFQSPGFYSIRLIVEGAGGSDTSMVENMIHVLERPPVAKFSALPKQGPYPLTVQFTDSSQGVVLSWFWDFGDSTQSTIQHPEHVYSEAGAYDVFLKVSGPGGRDSISVDHFIVVSIPEPIAVFSADTTWGQPPLNVHFDNWSQGEIDSCSWDFGDGEISSEFNPDHAYQNEGEFTVTLIVAGPGGSDTLIVNQMIHVNPLIDNVSGFANVPENYSLHPNTPNPFNPETQITFDLPKPEQVEVTVFDLRGQRIALLKSGICQQGQHTITWNGTDNLGRAVASGMYIIVLRAGKYRAQQKAIFMK